MTSTEAVLNKLLVQLFNDILKIEEKSLKNEGIKDLSMTEIHTIETIGITDARTMGEVANDLKITVGTLTTAINKLIKKGYVKRERTEEDKRVVLISLTEKGIEVHKKHQVFHNEMISTILNKCTNEEKKLLSSTMSELNNFFDIKYKSLL